MSTADNNKRIAKNTVFLYLRMLLILIVGLYTSRVVLATLGVNDFGLYNVVGGVVAMFAFLNTTLTTSTQRFLNFSLGKNDEEAVKTTFSTALLQHTLLVAIVLILAETVGLWFVINKLNIEPGRETAAIWVYQFSIIASCVNIFQLPFISTIIAHERMNAYAYVSIYEAIAKLAIVYAIQVSGFDKLIFYSFLVLAVQVTVAIFYNVYCRKKFSEARFSFKYDKALFNEMLAFSGWNVIGSVASTCKWQGVNILFNLFFGTVVNAARGVAFQVNNLVVQFANNFQIAVRPQIVKYFANGQMKEMVSLTVNSAKYSALMLLFISVPLFIEVDFVLKIWLGEYPEYTDSFIRIVIFQNVVSAVTSSVLMVVHASGKVKNVGITASIANMLVLPIAYLLFKLGFSPLSAMYLSIAASFAEQFIEMFWMRYYIKFPVREFYIKVYGMVIPLCLLMFSAPTAVHLLMSNSNEIFRFFVVGATSVLTSSIVLYKWGLDDNKRKMILSKLHLQK